MLVFGCSLSQLRGAASKPGVRRFDATWLHQIDSWKQQGFIYGYPDCQPSAHAAKASITDYQNAATEALSVGKASDPDADVKAIRHATTMLKSRDTGGAEHYTEIADVLQPLLNYKVSRK